MPIITISRGSYSYGQEVAEKVAELLGYECLAREVVLEASEQYDVPKDKLLHAVEDPPTLFERFSHSREDHIAYIRASLLKHFQTDNVVYHGLLGHFFLPEVSHVLRVRVLADREIRVAAAMERDKVSKAEAEKTLDDSDAERRKWASHLYHVDPEDPSLYDLVVHVGRISAAEAAEIICQTAKLPTFQASKRSQALVDDLALAAEGSAVLREHVPGVEVVAQSGDVVVKVPRVRIRGGSSSDFTTHYKQDLEQRVRALTLHLDGMQSLEVRVVGRD